MEFEQNRSLLILGILKSAYINVLSNVKKILIGSYILALIVSVLSFVLPSTPTGPSPDNYLIFITYLCAGMLMHVLLSTFLSRLLILGPQKLLKINLTQLLTILGKTFIYLMVLIFLLFLAMVALLLFIGLITSIVNGVTGQVILPEQILAPVVNIAMLAVTLLIFMRLQPTFISIAINKAVIPMKSAFFYTRNNNKELIGISLLGFIPSMMPLMLIYWVINAANITLLSGDILALLLFPLLLLPNIIVLSAGIEIYKILVPLEESGADKNRV